MALLKSVSGMLWGQLNQSGVNMVRDRGLVIRPKTFQTDSHLSDVESLIRRLKRYQTGFFEAPS